MVRPTIHLNGTGKQTLLGETEAAYRAIGDAITAINLMTIHMRDYYVQVDGQEAFDKARNRRDSQVQQLNRLQDEILQLHQAIEEQG